MATVGVRPSPCLSDKSPCLSDKSSCMSDKQESREVTTYTVTQTASPILSKSSSPSPCTLKKTDNGKQIPQEQGVFSILC
ncbi:hypothetical protein ACF0H5_019018 [Mactra antiquata]